MMAVKIFLVPKKVDVTVFKVQSNCWRLSHSSGGGGEGRGINAKIHSKLLKLLVQETCFYIDKLLS